MQSTRHDGQAPLHEAAEIGNTRLVQAFLALGADANIRDKVLRCIRRMWLKHVHVPTTSLLHW